MSPLLCSLELGANLAEGQGGVEDEVVTSGVSSANSAGKPLAYRKMAVQELYKDFDRLQEENLRWVNLLVVNPVFVAIRAVCQRKVHRDRVEVVIEGADLRQHLWHICLLWKKGINYSLNPVCGVTHKVDSKECHCCPSELHHLGCHLHVDSTNSHADFVHYLFTYPTQQLQASHRFTSTTVLAYVAASKTDITVHFLLAHERKGSWDWL